MGLGQSGEDLIVVQGVQYGLLQPQTVCAEGVEGYHGRGEGILELNLLTHVGEEVELHPLVLQEVEGALTGAHLLVAVELGDHVSHLQLTGVLGAVEGVLELAGHVGEALHEQGVEGAALAAQDHLHRLLVGEGGLIDPLAGEGVVHVGEGDDLGGYRDLVALEAVGIAPAVVSLVVPAADVPGDLHQRLVLESGKVGDHLPAHHGVGLHDLELLVGEASGLVEDLAGDGDLADVVEGGGGGDEPHVRPGEGVAVGHGDEAVEEKVRQGPDVSHMLSALPVAEFHDMAEDINHEGALPLLLDDLLGNKPLELFLLGVEQYGIDHPAVDHPLVEGAVDKVGASQVVGPLHMGGGCLGGNHDDRNILDPAVFLHSAEYIKAVHMGHHDVQQDQVDLRAVFLQDGQGPYAVLRLQDVVLLPQHIRKHGAVDLRVVGDEDLFSSQFVLNARSTHAPFL